MALLQLGPTRPTVFRSGVREKAFGPAAALAPLLLHFGPPQHDSKHTESRPCALQANPHAPDTSSNPIQRAVLTEAARIRVQAPHHSGLDRPRTKLSTRRGASLIRCPGRTPFSFSCMGGERRGKREKSGKTTAENGVEKSGSSRRRRRREGRKEGMEERGVGQWSG